MPIPPVETLFTLRGSVLPLADLVKAVDGSGKRGPSRPLGGWLTTYGKLGPDGGIVPTVDRDQQTFDAARELGHIDWSGYLPPHGFWNDTHRDGVIASPRILVGVPETLEFHDGTTKLSRLHGKVGFWTTGHLWDRDEPSSWQDFTDYVPSPLELDRADYYWQLANLILADVARKLAFSAHGKMWVDPSGRRILRASINQAAVCEVPRNPDATLEIMRRVDADEPLAALAKAVMEPAVAGTASPADLDLLGEEFSSLHLGRLDLNALIEKIMGQYLFTREQAITWLRRQVKRRNEATNGR